MSVHTRDQFAYFSLVDRVSFAEGAAQPIFLDGNQEDEEHEIDAENGETANESVRHASPKARHKAGV